MQCFRISFLAVDNELALIIDAGAAFQILGAFLLKLSFATYLCVKFHTLANCANLGIYFKANKFTCLIW